MKIRKIAQTPGVVATVVDNLNSESAIDALSAKQGKELKNMIENIGPVSQGALENFPIGTTVQYDGETVPEGWEAIEIDSIIVSPTEPTTGETVWIQKGKNLFNPKTMVELINAYRRYGDGVVTGQEGYNGIKIPVKPGTQYVLTTDCIDYSNLTFYDQNFSIISSLFRIDENKVIVTPENCYYFCMAMHNSYTWLQLEQGTIATEYEEYIDKKIYINKEKFLDVEKTNAQQNYSTEEQVIGTWIDGKPLYRKVVTGTTSSSENYHIFHIPNIKDMIHAYGVILNTNGIHAAFPMNWNEDIKIACEHIAGTQIALTYGTAYSGQPYTIIVEYTKNTD